MRAEVTAEAADLLAGLRRVREDSLRVAEYSASLTLALNGHRRERSEKANKEWKATEEENILAHLTDRQASEMNYFIKVVFWQWSFFMHRRRVIAPVFADEQANDQHLHEYLQHRHDCFADGWRDGIRKNQDDLENFFKDSQTLVADAQRRLAEVQDNNLQQCMNARVRHISALVLKSFFMRWAEFTHKLSFSRQKRSNLAKTINLIYEMEEGEWVAQALAAWHDWTSDRLEKRGEDIHQCKIMELSVPFRLVIFGDDLGRLSLMVIRSWYDATLESLAEQRIQQRELEAQLKLDEENQNSELFPDRIFSKTLGMIAFDVIDVYAYFVAWKRVSYIEPAQESLIKEALRKAEHRNARDILYRSYVNRASDSLDDILLESYFTTWCCSWHLAQRRSRGVVEKECRALTEGIGAWDSQARDVVAWQKLKKMVDVLAKRRSNRLRTTLQSLCQTLGTAALNPAQKSALEDMAAARTQFAGAVAEKKGVTDKISELYVATRRWQHQSRHAMIRFCIERGRECVMLMLLQWRLNLSLLRSERDADEKDSQFSALDESILVRHKRSERSHKISNLGVIGRLLCRFEFVRFLHGWRLGVAVASHNRKIEREDRAWAEKQMQMREDSGMHLSRRVRRQSEQVIAIRASVMTRVFAIHITGVQITFLSWKNLLVKNLPQRIADRALSSASRRQEYAICRAALKFWRLAVAQGKYEGESASAAEVALSDILGEQLHSRRLNILCRRMSRNLDLPLLREALGLWRKLHDVCCIDKAACEVQGMWSRWEQDAQARLQRMSASCSALVVFNMHKVRQEEFWKIAFIIVNVWRMASDSDKLRRHFDARHETADDALEAQRNFEALAREQWIEKCLFARVEAQSSRNVAQMLSAWQFFVKKSQRKVIPSKVDQVQLVFQYSLACRRGSRAQAAFAGWHGAACRSRRRWLTRQCRRLEGALGITQPPRARRKPSMMRKVPALSVEGLSSALAAADSTDSTKFAFAPVPFLLQQTSGIVPGTSMQVGLPLATSIGERVVPSKLPADSASDDFAKQLRAFTFGLGQNT